MATLSQHLRQRSKQICRDNGCTDDDHKCGSYAYITAERGQGLRLLDICLPDYFSGTSKPHAAITLPWHGNQKELNREVRAQCASYHE